MLEFRPGESTPSISGDALNAAAACVYAGSSAGLLTRLGQDTEGQRIVQTATQLGVALPGLTWDKTHANGRYLARENPDGSKAFVYDRDHSAFRQFAVSDIPAGYFGGVEWLLISGITQALLPEAIAPVIALAKQAGCRIAYDPNYRPALWPGPEAARQACLAALPHTDCFLPSAEDMKTLFEGPAEAVVKQLALTHGISTTVLKDGAHPIRWWQGAESGQCTIPAVESIQDTVGAGDAFNGGFLAGCLQHPSLPEAIMLGVRVSQTCLGHPGGLGYALASAKNRGI